MTRSAETGIRWHCGEWSIDRGRAMRRAHGGHARRMGRGCWRDADDRHWTGIVGAVLDVLFESE